LVASERRMMAKATTREKKTGRKVKYAKGEIGSKTGSMTTGEATVELTGRYCTSGIG
jgi:hypothetical protein